MKTIEELAQESHDSKKTGIPYSGLTAELKDVLRSKASAKLQAAELLALICEKSGQDPDEVHAVTDAYRELGYLRELPPLTVEE